MPAGEAFYAVITVISFYMPGKALPMDQPNQLCEDVSSLIHKHPLLDALVISNPSHQKMTVFYCLSARWLKLLIT